MVSRNRARGALLGLAAGDALGTTVEFSPRGTFEPVTDMTGGGPFHLAPGQWTDDTSMALCLAESILEGKWDPVDQLTRYVRWWRDGHLSSTDECFDIGTTVESALLRSEETGSPWSGSTDPYSAGNGSIMRLAPVALRYASSDELLERAAESSRTTHGAATAVDACRYLAALVAGALEGRNRDELLDPSFFTLAETPEVAGVAGGSFRHKHRDEIRGSGYVVESLEAALWALASSSTFEEGALLAVNLGDDADTTGAVYGQLAGALYGADGIPERWRDRLALRETIEGFADRLHDLSRAIVPDSYWVTDALAAGEYPGAKRAAAAEQRVRRFEGEGVTVFVDLTDPTDGLTPYEELLRLARRAHHPIVDNDIPTVAEMTATLDSIDAALADGETVYVHCWGGIGRTGTVIGCWLVRHGATPDEAIALIRERRRPTPDYLGQPDSPQTPDQHRFVRDWLAGR